MADRAFDRALAPREAHPWVAEGRDRVRFGVSIYPQPTEWSRFMGIVRRMEELGYDSYWSYDHPTAHADCWTALTALALATERIRLGTMVACVYYRGPYLLARMAADVDRLSGGRLVLGLGIGHVVDEFGQVGIPFPPTPVRQRALEETVAIVRGLWSGEPFDYRGEQVAARSDGGFLGPVQAPYVPLLLAGGGERVTLRQVARFADASNMGAHDTTGSAATEEAIARKFGKLGEYCAEVGRPFESVLRSHFTMPLVLAETREALAAKLAGMPRETLARCGPALFAGTPAEAIAFYRGLAGAGFQYFIANVLDGDEGTIELLGTEVMPAFGAADGPLTPQPPSPRDRGEGGAGRDAPKRPVSNRSPG
jgi:alkanesulfonate monooxygenase SsuD/methylene tetrahydromethanopterin reductase-like flavin-dependent oxidoreductase (luciferase family)